MEVQKITFEDKVSVVPAGIRINQIQDVDINEIKTVINNHADSIKDLATYAFSGSIKPTDAPVGTGKAVWFATQAGVYTNHGNFTVDANSFAVFSRDAAGVFTFSQTPLDISSKVNVSDVINTLTSTETTKPLSAAMGKFLKETIDAKEAKIKAFINGPYPAESQVNSLGKDWYNTVATVAGEIPGTSSKWVERLTAYLSKQDALPISKKLTDNLSKLTTKTKRIILELGGYYHYKTGVYSANASFSSLKLNAVEGDIYSFKGDIGFSSIAAISFFDTSMNNLGYIFGDNTSTIVFRDTGVVICPKNTAFIVFGNYSSSGVECEVFQHQVNSFVDSIFTKKILENVKKISVTSDVAMTNAGLYNKSGALILPADLANAADFKYATVNVLEGEICNYKSSAFYGSGVFGVIMLDINNNILDRFYTTGSWSVTANFDETFVIPKNCVKLLVNLKLNALSSFSKLTVNSDRFLVPADLPTGSNGTNSPYVNAWSYNFLTSISADYLNSGFAYDATNKMATATVANSYLILNKNFKSYKRIHSYLFKLTADSVFHVGSSALTTSVAYQSRGSVVLVDIPNLKIKILNVNTLATLIEVPITGFVAGEYSLDIFQNDLGLTATLKNNKTLNTTVVSYTSTSVDSQQGKLIDYPSVKLISGTVSIISNDIFLMYKPLIVFVGDSITESGYRVNSYAIKLLAESLKQDGTIIAKGGANHDVLYLNALTELIKMKPKYVSLLIGTNGGFTTSQINVWKTFCDTNDIKLIINKIPITSSDTTYPYLVTNQAVIDSGVYGSRFDYVTAVNNNVSEGQNTSLFADTLHPNDAGQILMKTRFLSDVKLI